MDGTDVVDRERTNRRAESESRPAAPPVSALRSSPDRVVFTEDGNADGWISIDADLTASIER